MRRGGWALTVMLPFETTKTKQTDRQTNSQEYYRRVVHGPRGAHSAPERTSAPGEHSPPTHAHTTLPPGRSIPASVGGHSFLSIRRLFFSS